MAQEFWNESPTHLATAAFLAFLLLASQKSASGIFTMSDSMCSSQLEYSCGSRLYMEWKPAVVSSGVVSLLCLCGLLSCMILQNNVSLSPARSLYLLRVYLLLLSALQGSSSYSSLEGKSGNKSCSVF